MFATLSIGVMGTFSLIIPETKGRSLEEMDVIFGAANAETRQQDVEGQQVVLGAAGDEGLGRPAARASNVPNART